MCCIPHIKSRKCTHAFLVCLCWSRWHTNENSYPPEFCFMSWQWAFWVFDDGCVFICKFKAICINLVCFQAFCISEHHIWLYNAPDQMPAYTLIQYMQEEKIYENVTVTFWLRNRSGVPSHLEVRDCPCWFLRLLSLEFMILWHPFPEVVNLKNQSLNAIKSTLPLLKTK